MSDHIVDQYPYAGIIKGKIVDKSKYDFYFSDDRIKELFTENTKTINGQSIFGSGNIVINGSDNPSSSLKLHNIYFYGDTGEVGFIQASSTNNLELGASILNINTDTFSLGNDDANISGDGDYITISSKELKWIEKEIVKSIGVEIDSKDYSYVGWNGEYFQWTSSTGKSFYTPNRNPSINDKVYIKDSSGYSEYKYNIDKRSTQPSTEYLFSDILAKTEYIFTKTSQLENDAEFVTKSYIDLRDDEIADIYKKLNLKANIGSIPSKTSQLTNDSGYITGNDIPLSLKNPYSLNWTTGSTKNVVAGTYDGSKEAALVIPTKYSDLTADITYLTSHQSLAAYALKTDIPTTLRNPETLTWSIGTGEGATTGSYNGSEQVSFIIPEKVTDLVDSGNYTTKTYVKEQLSTKFDYAYYDEDTKKIIFKSGGKSGTELITVDATSFIKYGMINSVEVIDSNLVITFNTDAGEESISISIADIFAINDFNIEDYYTSAQVDNLLAKKTNDTDLAKVAKTGSYNDLTDKPTELKNSGTLSWTGYNNGSYDGDKDVSFIIPSKYSDLVADITYLTEHQSLKDYAKRSDIPTSLKNPEALIWSIGTDADATQGTYDGNTQVSFIIPKNVTDLADSDDYSTKNYVDTQDATKFDDVIYNETAKTIDFKSNGVVKKSLDATQFIKDGMISTVEVKDSNLIITFNTDTGKDTISIPINDIFDASSLFSDLTFNDTTLSATIGGTIKSVEILKSNYAVNAGNADTIGNTPLGGLFTDFSNSINKISITIGGTTKTLTPAYAITAGTANKVSSSLSWSGYSSGTYDGSTEVEIKIPNKLSDLENDKNYATEEYVNTQIENIQTSVYWEN